MGYQRGREDVELGKGEGVWGGGGRAREVVEGDVVGVVLARELDGVWRDVDSVDVDGNRAREGMEQGVQKEERDAACAGAEV